MITPRFWDGFVDRCGASHLPTSRGRSQYPRQRDWSLTNRRNELVKIGVRIVTHTRYVALQMIEVAATRESFQGILPLIDGLRTGPRVRHLGNGG